jgi:hypothetical protein
MLSICLILFNANSVSKVLCFIPFKLMTTSYVGFRLFFSPCDRPSWGGGVVHPVPPPPGVRGWGQLYSFREIEWEKGGGSEGWRREKGAGDWKRLFEENDIEEFKLFISYFFEFMRHQIWRPLQGCPLPLSHIPSYTSTPISPRFSTSISWFSHSPDTDNLDLFLWRLFLLYVSLVFKSSNQTYRICAELVCAFSSFIFYLGVDGLRNVYGAESTLLVLFTAGSHCSITRVADLWEFWPNSKIVEKKLIKNITKKVCLFAMSKNQPIGGSCTLWFTCVYSSTCTTWTARRILYILKLIFFLLLCHTGWRRLSDALMRLLTFIHGYVT